jgi:hypothetical protein
MRRKMNETTAHKMPNEIGIVRSVGNLDLAPDLSSHDNSNVGEFDDSRGGNLTGEQELQIRVLEEAVSCAQGRGLKGNKKKLRDEAIRWLRGDDDCVELGPFNSAACFHAAGIDQQAAILSMGIPS